MRLLILYNIRKPNAPLTSRTHPKPGLWDSRKGMSQRGRAQSRSTCNRPKETRSMRSWFPKVVVNFSCHVTQPTHEPGPCGSSAADADWAVASCPTTPAAIRTSKADTVDANGRRPTEQTVLCPSCWHGARRCEVKNVNLRINFIWGLTLFASVPTAVDTFFAKNRKNLKTRLCPRWCRRLLGRVRPEWRNGK